MNKMMKIKEENGTLYPNLLCDLLYIKVGSAKKTIKKKRVSTKGKAYAIKVAKEAGCDISIDFKDRSEIIFPLGKQYDGCCWSYYLDGGSWAEIGEEIFCIVNGLEDWSKEEWLNMYATDEELQEAIEEYEQLNNKKPF